MSIDERLSRVFETVMDVPAVDDSMSVTNVENWDSHTHILLVTELEKEFGIHITSREAGSILSIPEIKSLLERKGVSPSNVTAPAVNR